MVPDRYALVAGVLAVVVGAVLVAPTVGPATDLLLLVGTRAFGVVRPSVLAAISVVSGADRRAGRAGRADA